MRKSTVGADGVLQAELVLSIFCLTAQKKSMD